MGKVRGKNKYFYLVIDSFPNYVFFIRIFVLHYLMKSSMLMLLIALIFSLTLSQHSSLSPITFNHQTFTFLAQFSFSFHLFSFRVSSSLFPLSFRSFLILPLFFLSFLSHFYSFFLSTFLPFTLFPLFPFSPFPSFRAFWAFGHVVMNFLHVLHVRSRNILSFPFSLFRRGSDKGGSSSSKLNQFSTLTPKFQ